MMTKFSDFATTQEIGATLGKSLTALALQLGTNGCGVVNLLSEAGVCRGVTPTQKFDDAEEEKMEVEKIEGNDGKIQVQDHGIWAQRGTPYGGSLTNLYVSREAAPHLQSTLLKVQEFLFADLSAQVDNRMLPTCATDDRRTIEILDCSLGCHNADNDLGANCYARPCGPKPIRRTSLFASREGNKALPPRISRTGSWCLSA